ncbi:MAG: hypothetical protein LBL32_02430 [Holosporales bacterium]|jgi:hypothetical protein|nr:hypothetical protein [Holosporales bacterium]
MSKLYLIDEKNYFIILQFSDRTHRIKEQERMSKRKIPTIIYGIAISMTLAAAVISPIRAAASAAQTPGYNPLQHVDRLQTEAAMEMLDFSTLTPNEVVQLNEACKARFGELMTETAAAINLPATPLSAELLLPLEPVISQLDALTRRATKSANDRANRMVHDAEGAISARVIGQNEDTGVLSPSPRHDIKQLFKSISVYYAQEMRAITNARKNILLAIPDTERLLETRFRREVRQYMDQFTFDLEDIHRHIKEVSWRSHADTYPAFCDARTQSESRQIEVLQRRIEQAPAVIAQLTDSITPTNQDEVHRQIDRWEAMIVQDESRIRFIQERAYWEQQEAQASPLTYPRRRPYQIAQAHLRRPI